MKTFQEACEFVAKNYLDARPYVATTATEGYLETVVETLDKVRKNFDAKKERQCLFGWSIIATSALHYLIRSSKLSDDAAKARELIVQNNLNLMFSKQHDYGHGNITKFGEFGVLVRCSDKISRLENLAAKGKDPKNESTLDTWIDILNYAIIAIMLHLSIFTLPYVEDDTPAK